MSSQRAQDLNPASLSGRQLCAAVDFYRSQPHRLPPYSCGTETSVEEHQKTMGIPKTYL